MPASLRHRLSYANVMATVAVFIVLGSSSYAALRVTGRNVPEDALTGANIKHLTGKDVRNNSLTGTNVTNKSLTPKDFTGSVRGPGPPGPLGATGAKGDDGDPGPADPLARRIGRSSGKPTTSSESSNPRRAWPARLSTGDRAARVSSVSTFRPAPR